MGKAGKGLDAFGMQGADAGLIRVTSRLLRGKDKTS